MQKWFRSALALVAGALILTVACNKGDDSPTGSSPVTYTPSTPSSGGTASAPAPTPAPAPAGSSYVATSGVCNGKVVHTTANGIMGYCVLDTNLPGLEGCLNIDPEKVGDRIYMKIGIVYKGGGGGYTRTAIFAENDNVCRPTESNNGADPENNGKSFKDGDIIELWRPVRPDHCGLEQWDGDIRDGDPANRLDVLGFMLVYPRACPSCEAFDVQLTVTGEGLTRTVKVTFKGQRPSKKALVDFGDGTTAEFTNGQSMEHTWPYGEYTVKATLEADGLSCFKSVIVKNEKICQVEWIEQEPEITYGEWGECKANTNPTASNGEPQCSQSRSVRTVIKEKNSCTGEIRVKSDKTTTESRPCECACVPEWIEQEPEITYGEWGECKAPETASSTVRPECSQSRTVRTVIKEKNSCTGEVRVKSDKTTTESRECECKKDSCDNYTPPTFGGALALTNQTATQVTVTSGTVSPPGGTFSPTLPSVQSRPPAGSGDATFETDYTVSYGPAELECEAEREYTIKIPQQESSGCPPPSTTMSVNWTILREATYGNNPDCSDFGLASLYKKEFSSGVQNWSTDRAASIVIVKDGKCTDGGDYFATKASPTDSTKWIGAGLGVSFTCDGKAKDLSHVEMCGCPLAGASAQGSGMFDPYAVPDPTQP